MKLQKRSQVIIILTFLTLNYFGISYVKYYELINKAEETFIFNKNRTCFNYYDSAFRLYSKPYVKDTYIAAQIALYLRDTNSFYKYIALAFKNGMPLSAVSSAPFLRKVEAMTIYAKIKELYLKNRIQFKFDFAAREAILKKCFEGDSLKSIMGIDSSKIREYYASENKFREYLFENYLLKGRFPNEHIIGIATDTMYNSFLKRNNKRDPFESNGLPTNVSGGLKIDVESIEKMEYDLVSKFSLSVLLHSKCSFTKFKEQMWTAVLNGYFHPKEYAMMHEMSKVWNQTSFNDWDDCKNIHQEVYYNILGNNPMSQNHTFVTEPSKIEIVEKNRKELYLQKFSIEVLKKKFQKETGLRFFFGFLDFV